MHMDGATALEFPPEAVVQDFFDAELVAHLVEIAVEHALVAAFFRASETIALLKKVFQNGTEHVVQVQGHDGLARRQRPGDFAPVLQPSMPDSFPLCRRYGHIEVRHC